MRDGSSNGELLHSLQILGDSDALLNIAFIPILDRLAILINTRAFGDIERVREVVNRTQTLGKAIITAKNSEAGTHEGLQAATKLVESLRAQSADVQFEKYQLVLQAAELDARLLRIKAEIKVLRQEMENQRMETELEFARHQQVRLDQGSGGRLGGSPFEPIF